MYSLRVETNMMQKPANIGIWYPILQLERRNDSGLSLLTWILKTLHHQYFSDHKYWTWSEEAVLHIAVLASLISKIKITLSYR